MKKILLTILLVYIAVRSMCLISGFLTFFLSIGVSFGTAFILMVVWNIYPLCKITKVHKPILKNGIYYCKYCNQPLKRL